VTVMILEFGKYRGCHVRDVPLGYLAWALAADFRAEIHDAFRHEVARRLSLVPAEEVPRPSARRPEPLRPPDELVRTVREITRKGFQKLSHDKHPDHGGDGTEMRHLIEAREWLKAQGIA